MINKQWQHNNATRLVVTLFPLSVTLFPRQQQHNSTTTLSMICSLCPRGSSSHSTSRGNHNKLFFLTVRLSLPSKSLSRCFRQRGGKQGVHVFRLTAITYVDFIRYRSTCNVCEFMQIQIHRDYIRFRWEEYKRA